MPEYPKLARQQWKDRLIGRPLGKDNLTRKEDLSAIRIDPVGNIEEVFFFGVLEKVLGALENGSSFLNSVLSNNADRAVIIKVNKRTGMGTEQHLALANGEFN